MTVSLAAALVALLVLAVLLWRQRRRTRQLEAHVAELAEQLHERTGDLTKAEATLKQLSTVDGVTGVANHRQFQDTLRSEWRRALR